jgi:hypothetical protein
MEKIGEQGIAMIIRLLCALSREENGVFIHLASFPRCLIVLIVFFISLALSSLPLILLTTGGFMMHDDDMRNLFMNQGFGNDLRKA